MTCNFFGERGGEAVPLSKKITGHFVRDPQADLTPTAGEDRRKHH